MKGKFLKNLLNKNSALDRKMKSYVRGARFGPDGLFVWSIGTFVLAGLFWFCGFWTEFRFFRAALFLVVTFIAPSLVIISVIDMVRSKWEWIRLFALFISLGAVGFLVAGVDRLIWAA